MRDTLMVQDPAPPGGGAGLDLELVRCPLCGADSPEPVAVGNDFAHRSTADSFLAVRCPQCALVYLDPCPSPDPRTYPAEYFSPHFGSSGAARRAIARVGALAEGSRVLVVEYGAARHLEVVCRIGGSRWTVELLTPHDLHAQSARSAGVTVFTCRATDLSEREDTYDLVFMLDGLEHCPTPVEELAAVARLLRRGGRIVLVTQNAESAAGRLFRGRHWAGYDFPRHPCLYGPSALRRLASKAGLVVERLDTARRPEVWARSAAYFLEDWGAPHWARRLASPRSPVARGVAVLIETGSSTFGGGAALETVLRPDDEGAR